MPKQKFNQKGIAHLAVIAVLVLIIAGVGFAAWRVMGTKTTHKTEGITKISTGSSCGTEMLDQSDFNFNVSASGDASINADGSSSSNVSSNSTSGLTIANKCFNTAFKNCTVAGLSTVANFKVEGGGKADEQTDYLIIGPKPGGCEVKETFTKSTILPKDLVGTDLICTYDNKLIFTDALIKSANNNGLKDCTGSYIDKTGPYTSN